MPDFQSATQLSLSFAKLVATPTDTSWSQAYNAGNVFSCISLTADETAEELSLQAIGKELFNVLQAEFFTLNEKNIENIKTAIQTSLSQVPQEVTANVTLAYFKDAKLLVFIAGMGKIIIKRGERIGVLLEKHGTDDAIISASGFVTTADTIILETGQFAANIPREVINQALELALPNDIVEALSPQMHKQDNGAQAAIVISCMVATPHPFEEAAPTEEPLPIHKHQSLPQQREAEPEPESKPESEHESTSEQRDEPEYEDELEDEEEKPKRKLSLPKLPQFHFPLRHFNFNHRRRLFLNIALIIALLLIISIFFTIKKYHDNKERALFQSVYPQAQQYYSEGKGLATVNAKLSQDSYKKAENLLTSNESKFSKNSTYYKQIASLLSQVQSAQTGNATGQSTNVSAAQAQPHSLLAVEQANGDGLAFGQDTNNVYEITTSSITAISRTDGSTKTLTKNNNDWSAPVAIVPYNSNIYVLDQKKGLLKFVAGGGGYGKSTYFKNNAPTLSSATGMAIDSSVWLVFKDGSIQNYISGTSNNIQISGLLKPLSNPKEIVTDANTEGVYVLDTGNSRIVKFDKTGKYQAAYSASVLATAKDFTVDETNKKIQILSGGKVWEMNM